MQQDLRRDKNTGAYPRRPAVVHYLVAVSVVVNVIGAATTMPSLSTMHAGSIIKKIKDAGYSCQPTRRLKLELIL